MLGARAVLADIDPLTLQLDPADVRRRLTARTRAVIPVHFAGAPVDLDAIQEAVGGRNVAIVEDAAHALGTSYRGHEIGSQSRAAVFSFHPTKNITTGEGAWSCAAIRTSLRGCARCARTAFRGMRGAAMTEAVRRDMR